MKTFNNTGNPDSYDIVHMKGDKDKYTITELNGKLTYESISLDRTYIVDSVEEMGFKYSNGVSTRFKWNDESNQFGNKHNCLSWRNAGFTNDGIYTINPSGTNFNVYCDMTTDGGGWTMIVSAISTSPTLSTVAAQAFNPINSDNMNITNEGISNYINESEWNDMLVYTRGFKVKGTNVNKDTKSVSTYVFETNVGDNTGVGMYKANAYADTLELIGDGTVSSTAINGWSIGMGINFNGNDSDERSHLHFGPAYIPQGFATHRTGSGDDMKIDNGYSNDKEGVTNDWDSASTTKQIWFVR